MKNNTPAKQNAAKLKASKYRGVYKCGKDKWKAQIQIEGTQHYLGVFESQEKAAREYNLFAIRHGRPDTVNNIESSKAPSQYVTEDWEIGECHRASSNHFDDLADDITGQTAASRSGNDGYLNESNTNTNTNSSNANSNHIISGSTSSDSSEMLSDSSAKIIKVSKDAFSVFQLTVRMGVLIRKCLHHHKSHDYSQFL